MPTSDESKKRPSGICYLRGTHLKSANEVPENHPDRESLEHIIPNAIGGKLKSKDILSHAGNQKLNKDIDTEFVKIFTSFTTRLQLQKDRKSSPSMTAFHLDHEVKLTFKDGRYFPKAPHYDVDSKTIYANSIKNAENFKKNLINKGVISKDEEVRLADDMAGTIQMPFELGNKNFKQGMAKIAIGYASLNGVAREHLIDALDIDSNSIADTILLVPSLPTTESEDYFEKNITSSPNYPCHTLTLCGHQGILYCHIELFNAFQWYVILNENYKGEEIFKTYTHDLLNDKEITRNEYISSIKMHPALPELNNYRKLHPLHLERIAQVFSQQPAKVKSYNHFKFNQLSNFTKNQFVYNKAVELGLIEATDDCSE